MVIDEIGRSAEVSAVATVKARGVRMLASAHGSFKELYHNAQLKGLLGTFVPVRTHAYCCYTLCTLSIVYCILAVYATTELDTTNRAMLLLRD
jgi:hypothetical protein